MERVPNEIFHIIFELSIFENPRNDGASSYDGLADYDISEGKIWPSVFQFKKGPWAINRVCRKWRKISSTFPQLWSCFSLNVHDLDPNIDGTATLTTWLSFSGTNNLSFLIEPDGICNDANRSRWFELLTDRADRWQKIEFYNSTSTLWSMLYTHDVRSRLGSLRRIAIHSEEANLANDALSGDPAHYQVFRDTPQLHSLINRNHLPAAGLDLPWAQLTEYEGSHRVRVEDHLHLLRGTPKLEKCRLEIAYVRAPADQTQSESSECDVVLLPNLRILQVRTTWFSNSIQDLPTPIRRFRLPALKTLHIISEHLSRTPPPFSVFAEVLRSSSCELHTLKLSSRGASGIENLRSDDIINLLRSCPALRYFCITVGISGSSRVLQDTIIPRLDIQSEDVLLPVLETLELRLPSPSAIPMVDLTGLATAIRSRWTTSGSESIRSLRFIVQLGDVPLDRNVLLSAIRVPIMEICREVDIVIETINGQV
ncbi:hypothetical protein L218DRAFT_382080 [Marasmius fiardii PR-910]|nr:hypothetical protein L218DRAFT_382080 [Marasmius fiardii PR-910]